MFYCEKHGCKISESGCAARQNRGKRPPFRVPVDDYCRSGGCKQGAAAVAALESQEQEEKAQWQQTHRSWQR